MLNAGYALLMPANQAGRFWISRHTGGLPAGPGWNDLPGPGFTDDPVVVAMALRIWRWNIDQSDGPDPAGDGSVLVKPDRPIKRLTILQFALAVGYSSRTSVYDRLGTDEIPERFIERVGPRKVRIQAAAVEHFRTYHRARRDGGIEPR